MAKKRCCSKRIILVAALATISGSLALANQRPDGETCYLFSYFKGNGEDGLHLAYSYDGLKFKVLNNDKPFLAPKAGQDRLMRDPCIIKGPDGKFHMVWTVSWKEKGVGYAHSRDLIQWSQQKYIPVMEHEPKARNTWAPELFYDEVSKQYLIFWATTIPGRFSETDGQGGGKLNHRMYYTTTKDFKTFSKTKLFYNRGFNVIDATIVKDRNRYVMFLKDETNTPFKPQKNIRLATSENAEGPYGPPSPPITGNYWCEGPSAIKIKDTWFVYFDKYRKHRYGAVTSKDLKTWQDISDKVSFPQGTRHGTVFEVSNKMLADLLAVGGQTSQRQQEETRRVVRSHLGTPPSQSLVPLQFQIWQSVLAKMQYDSRITAAARKGRPESQVCRYLVKTSRRLVPMNSFRNKRKGKGENARRKVDSCLSGRGVTCSDSNVLFMYRWV